MEEPKVPFYVGVSFIASSLPRKTVNRLFGQARGYEANPYTKGHLMFFHG